jgi:hypothetical protein
VLARAARRDQDLYLCIEFMRRFLSPRGGAAALCAIVLGAGCEDRVPTFPEGQLPGQSRAQTIELLLPAADFLRADTVFDGFASQNQFGALVVANRFGDGLTRPPLQSNALARFAIPDTVVYTRAGTVRTDSVASYVGGEITALLQGDRSRIDGDVELSLHVAAEAWDTSATWQLAEGVPGAVRSWQTPGGTRGALLARIRLAAGDAALPDTLRWAMDSVAMARLTEGARHGVVITAEGAQGRLQLVLLSLRAEARPVGVTDTVVPFTIFPAAQRFVFTPEPPIGGDGYEVGGVRGARTVLRLQLPETLPACPPGSPPCGTVRMVDARLNQVALLMTPQRNRDGFEPLGTSFIQLRRMLEPELGRFSPLGVPGVGGDSIPARSFAMGPDTTIAVQLVPDLIRRMVADTTRTATIALLDSPEGGFFGVSRLRRDMRLRIIYTILPQPTLP